MMLPMKTALWLSIAMMLNITGASAGWKLTFSDEFDGPRLNLGKWKRADLWSNGTLAGNRERQCYVPSGVRQSDGMLLLVAKQFVTPAANCKGANADLDYISGVVSTAGCNQWETSEICERLRPFSQTYGFFEIRAKLPRGKGLWPAFWLVPIDGSWPPEIDVMEALGQNPSTIYFTYHYTDAAGAQQKAGKAYNGHDFASSFSTFAVDWRPGVLIWYVDGKEAFRFASPDVTSKKMYLLLNLAVGGNWPGDPDRSTTFPSSMAIDYVHVYKRIDDGTPDNEPPIALTKSK
jgi:beta-glucanase (GH16 family)